MDVTTFVKHGKKIVCVGKNYAKHAAELAQGGAQVRTTHLVHCLCPSHFRLASTPTVHRPIPPQLFHPHAMRLSMNPVAFGVTALDTH